jgi:P27 family predicted phage terminase small subunit
MPDNVRRIRGTKPLRDPDTGEKVKRLVLPPVAPKAPEGLSRKASAEWRRVVPELERAGVLAEIDRGALTAYVTAWAHMQDAEEILKKEGLIRTTKDGAARHPAWIVYREANRTMLAAARELYLTPTSRLRIPVPRGAAADDGSGDDLFD